MTDGLKPTMKQPSPWFPMTSQLDLALFGKAAEEGGEYVSALSRCIIQGLDEAHPRTGKINREWLQEEMADIYATLELLEDRLAIDKELFLIDRIEEKKRHLRGWFALVAVGEAK